MSSGLNALDDFMEFYYLLPTLPEVGQDPVKANKAARVAQVNVNLENPFFLVQ